MFKFSFNVENDENNPTDQIQIKDDEQKTTWQPSEEVKFGDINLIVEELKKFEKVNVCALKEIEIFYLNPAEILDKCSKTVLSADSEHSDLVKGLYEGGLKIWECTYDLGDYISTEIADQLKGKSVLDLGCGSGILGIVALEHGANVEFQDYNKDVLQNFTINNVLLNFEENCHEIMDRSTFYSGDWCSYNQLTSNTTFDVILTSETIYNPDNYEKLLKVLKNKLKPDGVIYLAAKIYYFGVGGGLREFENIVNKDDALTTETVWKCTTGVQREIIKLTFSKKPT